MNRIKQRMILSPDYVPYRQGERRHHLLHNQPQHSLLVDWNVNTLTHFQWRSKMRAETEC